jgi:predicted nucleic acid-binding protein
MAPKNCLRVFLDTSVVFAAVLSPSGGARKLFYLAGAGLLKLVLSRDVLRECEEVVRRKSPSSLPWLARLLDIGGVTVSPAPARNQLRKAKMHVRHPPDALILAGAIAALPEWFVTHGQEHFLKPLAEKKLSFRVGTPGDLIRALRDACRTA